jgi:hypothetical protein
VLLYLTWWPVVSSSSPTYSPSIENRDLLYGRTGAAGSIVISSFIGTLQAVDTKQQFGAFLWFPPHYTNVHYLFLLPNKLPSLIVTTTHTPLTSLSSTEHCLLLIRVISIVSLTTIQRSTFKSKVCVYVYVCGMCACVFVMNPLQCVEYVKESTMDSRQRRNSFRCESGVEYSRSSHRTLEDSGRSWLFALLSDGDLVPIEVPCSAFFYS